MKMRLAAAALLFALAGATAHAQAPDLAVGDFWRHEFWGNVTVDGELRPIRGTLVTKVVSGGNETVAGQPVEAFMLQTNSTTVIDAGGRKEVRANATTYRVVRASDHATIREAMLPGTIGEASRRESIRRDWSHPCPALRFPLQPGRGWDVECRGREWIGDERPQDVVRSQRYLVGASIDVTTPAGRLGAFEVAVDTVENGEVSSETLVFAPAACTEAERSVHDDDGSVLTRFVLVEFRCGAAGGGSPEASIFQTGSKPQDPGRKTRSSGLSLAATAAVFVAAATFRKQL